MEKNYHFTKSWLKIKPMKQPRIKLLLILLLAVITSELAFAQTTGCADCTITDPTPVPNTPLTISQGQVVCITQNLTFDGLNFTGGTLCIAPGDTLVINNNVTTTAGTTINLEIYGTLIFNNATPTINSDVNLNVYEGGTLKSGYSGNGNFDFNGSGENYINNYGRMEMNVLDFTHQNGEYFFDNFGEIVISGNINISATATKFKNEIGGIISVASSFSMNGGSSFYNCGSITANSGFNMQGGYILNTGIFNVNSYINLGAITARVDNYGSFNVTGNIQLGDIGSVFYNEGVTTITNGTFERNGAITGPAAGSGKLGYIYFDWPANMNSGSIGPNLNFKYTGDTQWGGTSSFEYMFQNRTNIVQNSPVYWDCESTNNCVAPKQFSLNLCPDFNGQLPPVPTTRLWVGTESTIPTNPANWSNNTLPNPGDHVEFATEDNNNGNTAINDLKTTDDMIIGNLTNASDKNLIISEGTSVVINGKVTITDPVTGQPSTDPSKIQVKASDGNANGSLIINCDENSTSGVPNSIYATIELYAKGEKGHEYSWLDTIPGSPTNNKVTYTGDYRWQHFGVPVKSVKANPTFSGAFLREYSEPLNKEDSYYFKWIILNNESNLTKFKGYEITQDAPTRYYIKGELVFCGQEITLTHSAAAVQGSTDQNEYNSRYGLGQNIFGNSFTASIPIEDIVFENGVENVVYMYNTGTFGEWAAISSNPVGTAQAAGTYIAIPKETASTMDYGSIPSMQGFLLRHLAPNGNQSPITMSLPYMSLTKNTKPQLAPRFNGGKTNDELGFVRVQLSSKSTVDNLWFFSQPGTSENYDNGWDGRKYFGTPTAFIFSETPDGPMQVNTSETIDGNVISFYPNGDKEYTFAIVKSNLDNYRDLHLVDIATKKIVSLQNDTTMYHFTSNVANKINKRFVIVNKAIEQISFDNDEFDLLDAYLSSKNNELTVSNFTGKNGIMRIYDVAGSLVMNDEMVTGTNQYQPNLNPGIYILNLSASGKEKSIKILIKKP